MLLKNRPAIERQLAHALASISDANRRAILAAFDGRAVSPQVWPLVVEQLKQLQPHLAAIYGTNSQRMTEKLGDRPPREMHESAGYTWAARYLKSLAQEMADSLRARVDAIELAPETNFADELLRIFSAERDAVIAATETTRAQVAGEYGAAHRWNRLHPEQQIEPRWRTEHDEKTCWICDPLDNQREVTYGIEFPTGPPAHPNCRCWLDWSEPAEATGRQGDVILTRAAA